MVNKVNGFPERSGTKRISTSLQGFSSPRAKEPKSHAFKTGCVSKYLAIICIMDCVLMVIVWFDGAKLAFSLKVAYYFKKNNPGVMLSQRNTVSPQTRISTQEMVIMVMPNLKASVWLYWLVL